MAKKAADADGGSRATKSSVQQMVESNDLDTMGTRLAVPFNIFNVCVYQSCELFIGFWIDIQARIRHSREGRRRIEHVEAESANMGTTCLEEE